MAIKSFGRMDILKFVNILPASAAACVVDSSKDSACMVLWMNFRVIQTKFAAHGIYGKMSSSLKELWLN